MLTLTFEGGQHNMDNRFPWEHEIALCPIAPCPRRLPERHIMCAQHWQGVPNWMKDRLAWAYRLKQVNAPDSQSMYLEAARDCLAAVRAANPSQGKLEF